MFRFAIIAAVAVTTPAFMPSLGPECAGFDGCGAHGSAGMIDTKAG